MASCQSGKLKAAGKVAQSLLNCHSKSAKLGSVVDPTCTTGAQDHMQAAFSKAENAAIAAGTTCATTGDNSAIAGLITQYVDAAVSALRPQPSVSGCSATKLRALATATGNTARAYAQDRRQTNGDKLTRAKANVATKLSRSFTKSELGSECATIGDATAVNGQLDSFASELAQELYPWPVVDSTPVSFRYPASQGSVGEPVVIHDEPGAVVLEVPLTVGSEVLTTFGIIVRDNSAHLSLEDWFAANVDPDGVLLPAGTFVAVELSDGRRALVNAAGIPDTYTGPPVPYAYVSSSDNTKIAVVSLSQDNDLDGLGYTTPEARIQLLNAIVQSLTFN